MLIKTHAMFTNALNMEWDNSQFSLIYSYMSKLFNSHSLTFTKTTVSNATGITKLGITLLLFRELTNH